MIATAAESNPSCFRAGPLADATSEVIPLYSKLVSTGGTGLQRRSLDYRRITSTTHGATPSIVWRSSSHQRLLLVRSTKSI